MALEKNDSQFSSEDEVTSDLMKFERVGDQVEGVLLDVREVKSQIDGSDQKIYEIQTADGEIKAVFGRKVIDQKMKVAHIGDMVKMVFAEEGKPRKPGMSGFKNIKVFVKKAVMTEADEVGGEDE